MYIDLIVKIKNAERAGKSVLKSRFTKTDKAVAEILVKHGFLGDAEVKGRAFKKFLEITLSKSPKISGVKFLSRPSRRIYGKAKDLKKPKGGWGLLLVSTSKGIMTSDEAKKAKLGGELLFEIW